MHDGEVAMVRSTTGLMALEPEWRTLWASDAHATPFQSPEWLLPWWRQFGQPELAAVVIRRRAKLVCLLPFYIYREPQSGLRQLLLIGAGTSDYLDGVFAPECSAADLARGLELLHSSVSWDQGFVTQLRGGSMLLQVLSGHAGRFATDSCWRTDLSVGSLPRKIRQNVVHRSNRAWRMGTVEYTVADAPTCLADFESLVRLHSERWALRGEGGVFRDPRVLEWHREALPLLARRGLVRLSCLRLNGETIAAMYCLADLPGRVSRSLYVYIPAFSPRFAVLSPGTLLLAHEVERAAAEGIETIDMLRGNEPYKQLWRAQPAPTFGCETPHRPSRAAVQEAA